MVPERGDRKKLLTLAQKNAASCFATRRNRQEDSDQALLSLKQRLGLSKLPRTIECYDISHIQGSDTVASMVVFVDGAPAKQRYRSFKVRGLDGLAWVVARLYGPAGCPWDRQQTHSSLRGALLEETHEVLEAIDAGDLAGLSEELGDLLLQIVLHSQLAEEAGEFTMTDVMRGLSDKLVRRHEATCQR